MATCLRALYVNNIDNNSNANSNYNLNNSACFVRITFASKVIFMVRDLYKELCSYENLVLAFKKARKHKTLKPCVIEYEKNLKENLLQLRAELLLKSYRTMPLKIFILKDPKTRKISVSDFRDRIVHHALCNIIQPFFETAFIYDSYANRIGKGTFKAIERFDFFKNKISHNNSRACFVLKADIRHYFEEVSHDILIDMLRKKIKDPSILWLVRIILENQTMKSLKRRLITS